MQLKNQWSFIITIRDTQSRWLIDYLHSIARIISTTDIFHKEHKCNAGLSEENKEKIFFIPVIVLSFSTLIIKSTYDDG
jgi:hypothetical protein